MAVRKSVYRDFTYFYSQNCAQFVHVAYGDLSVLVHKFVCRGTVEDKIDELVGKKTGLASDLLDGGGEVRLTEMSDDQLQRFVASTSHMQ